MNRIIAFAVNASEISLQFYGEIVHNRVVNTYNNYDISFSNFGVQVLPISKYETNYKI